MHLILRLISFIPLKILHPLGGLIGTMVWLCSETYRRHMAENLRLAGYDPKACVPKVRRELGMQSLETAWIWDRPWSSLSKHVRATPEAEALITRALQSGRPILFLTPHVGSFEVTPVWLARKHLDGTSRYMAILYRIPKKAFLRRLVLEGRETPGIVPAPADLSGVRTLFRAFRTKQIVGVLPDQTPSKGEGVWAPFFGRPAYTMTLPLRLAKQFDALKIVAWGRRIDGWGWEVGARLWDEPLTGDLLKDAGLMNRQLEEVIRQFPEQYLWSYNRYKRPAGAKGPDEEESR
ncbi:MAG: lysophospholipid acyltransferase family protein [Sutterellaceae bacterium]|nr:lysophospholipid acyltransferase family protein [Sutterellaceae bacterium]MDD7442423.1 lysophospholipid acyltransferase family protein [Sutterellaceae bacterium]MDY2868884.1 lysophospholipid acyltransferase family protein [Mesosutterella sp.]